MATADNTARDIRKPAKTAGRKPGVKAPTLPDKATALVMLDFLKGTLRKQRARSVWTGKLCGNGKRNATTTQIARLFP